MVKLSAYSNGYDNSPIVLTPWEFWTEQQRSYVINQAYSDRYLNSKEVKDYLSLSRQHMYTQFLFPALTGLCIVGMKPLFPSIYRKSPNHWCAFASAAFATTTILWLNLSPYYQRKMEAQQSVLDVLYHKVGTSMKLINDALPRSRTSTYYDLKTLSLFIQRNSKLAGTIFAEEDSAPPIRDKNISHRHANKKIYQ